MDDRTGANRRDPLKQAMGWIGTIAVYDNTPAAVDHSRCDARLGPLSAFVASVVAHQGGWDEALFVIGPLIVIVVLLRVAKRRADRNRSNQD